MSNSYSTPWHLQSYQRFLYETLPQLLAERLPLTGYHCDEVDQQHYAVTVQVAANDTAASARYTIPRPDVRGVFLIDNTPMLVIPQASSADLENAKVDCVGEILFELVRAHLGEAPAHLRWADELLVSWLPLEEWLHEFFSHDDYMQGASVLDSTNWLAIQTYLRRLTIRQPERAFSESQRGRACPIEVPEGPNMGRIVTIARGAIIHKQRLIIDDARPEAALGLSASMLPFLEYNDPPRLLMAANMLRQWLTPPDPEPALVQTGAEPDEPELWGGRNLLTAFISWDADTFEDGLVLSNSAAARLSYPDAAEPGDKLSNRHGMKGVISRILPDNEMPHLPDGRAVDIICSYMSVPSRMNLGQLREAVLGRIAQADGKAALAPAFHSPSEAELRSRLEQHGFAADGLETLILGRDGPALELRACVGWVYWGKLWHTARPKLRIWTNSTSATEHGADSLFPGFGAAQHQGQLEAYALYEAAAYENLREMYNTRAAERPDATSIAQQLAAGFIQQAEPPAPQFAQLTQRLAAAGIHARLVEQHLEFAFAPVSTYPGLQSIRLAQPQPHPWLPEYILEEVGILPELPAYPSFFDANQRLAQLLSTHAPPTLLKGAEEKHLQALTAYIKQLVGPEQLHFSAHSLFSARAVIAPGGSELRYDQLGLPDEIAWALFGPLLGAPASERHNTTTLEALDKRMADSWVLLNRAPSIAAHTFLAFRPVRVAGPSIRLPSLACNLLDADFDGDQVAVFLPVTSQGQREAAEKLSIAAHLRRDPALIREMRPRMDALLGLAWLSRSAEGRATIDSLAGTAIAAPNNIITARTVVDALSQVLKRDGAEAALDASERLLHKGFEVARRTGLSIGPFVASKLKQPEAPSTDRLEDWQDYINDMGDWLSAYQDYGDGDLGVLVLSIKSQARSNRDQLIRMLGCAGIVGQTAIRGGLRDGLSPDELCGLVSLGRAMIHGLYEEWEQLSAAACSRNSPQGYGVLARAMRSAKPGAVLARAAAADEHDPLHDPISRLWVGLD